MKSLLISGTYFPPQVGGISHFMAAVASALGPRQVCCLTGVPAAGAPTGDLGPRVYRRPAVFSRSSIVQAAALSAAITQIMVRERPRVVQLATAAEGHLGLWLERSLRLPYVIYAHGNEVLDAIQSAWAKPRLALRHAARVLANSRYTSGLVEEAGVGRERIEVVHPGCDVERFRPRPADLDLKRRLLGDRARDRVILSVGGLVARKGHDMVIRSLPAVLRRCADVTYLIVASHRRNYEQLDALARAAGVRDRVVLAWDVPADELPRVYALSDVFVMPSREDRDGRDTEGFGIVYIEANACGKPAVGGRSGGVADAVVEGVTGLLADPHDPADIAAALVRLLENPDLASRLGEQGRSRVVHELSWPRVGARIQAVLNAVVEEKRRPAEGGSDNGVVKVEPGRLT
ncbi:MAG: glycosyltransferase family 4 protein [Candidatus Rokuibacteriota bacterium]